LGLIAVSVDCFAGFIFMSPDPQAMPLAEFLGPAGPLLAAYRLDDMIPFGLNVRETIRANWKAALDAFLEGYHVQGIHPELSGFTDLRRERCGLFGWHAATTVPFGAPGQTDAGGEQGVAIVRGLPAANFPGLAEVLPRFEELVAGYGGNIPDEVAGRELLQRATRESMSELGADVSALTDNQFSDYQFWLMFPNVYMQLRSGEATVIWFRPDPGGDPNRCFWQVTNLQWFPEDERVGKREPLTIVPEGEHFPYFLALEQDFRQLEKQQQGLRNTALKTMHMTRQEPKVAHFHAGLDAWMEGRAS
jgi:phenylpropionate dioxygenase-like ring-hydroxylating dioxygenase large terminal subunit